MAQVQLGDLTFEVIDQPHAYLTHRLSGVATAILDAGGGMDGDDLVTFLGDGVYDVLAVFLPDLEKRLPRHEFHGYPNKAAMEEGVYDEEYARKTPTITQIVTAFNTGIEVNGGDFFRRVFGFLDPKLVRAVITERLADSLSTTSASSPPESGESVSTSSGVSGQPGTSMTGGSRSLASTVS